MAPGLNGCQSGSVPKNKSKRSCYPVGDLLTHAVPFARSSGSDCTDRRRPSTSHSEVEADVPRYNRHAISSENLVDNDNGELSWGIHNLGAYSKPPSRQPTSLSAARTRNIWMANDSQGSGSGSTNGASGSSQSNPPSRNQIVNKLSEIQDYIQQTESIMSALNSTESEECKEKFESLSSMLADLRDSESKLKNILTNMDAVDQRMDRLLAESSQLQQMNGDVSAENDLRRRADDSRRKVEALERQKQQLLEMQEVAQRQLVEAEAEQSRLLTRASTFSRDAISGTSLEATLQSFNDRIRNAERLRQEQIRLDDAVDHVAEQQDEEEGEQELSDTETDYQLVRDKVAELNAMKAQLAQLQAMMASIKTDQDAPDNNRRSQSRDPEEKLEKMRAKLLQVNRIVELAGNVDRSSQRSSSSRQSQPRSREEMSIETMQEMTRQLETQTALIKQERDRLMSTKNDLKNMARLTLGGSSSDSEEEPVLLPVNANSSSRSAEDGVRSRSSGRKSAENSAFLCRAVPPRLRQRSNWAHLTPPSSAETPRDAPERTKEKSRSNQSSVRNGEGGRNRGESSSWSPDAFNLNLMYQTQGQLDESANLCEQMMQDSVGRNQVAPDELTGILYSQQQMLTRTVSQCCKLIWLQQRQINELRDALVLQQSAALQSASSCPQPPQAPPVPLAVPPTFPGAVAVDFSANPSVSKPSDDSTAAAAAAFFRYQDEAAAAIPSAPNRTLPPPNPKSPSYDRFLHDLCFKQPVFFPRPAGADVPVAPNNQFPPAMPCYGPEVIGPSGALNNQVPPGNRANNYWDNFRSYSRQNLLSTPKSNEDSEQHRRAPRSDLNTERTPLSTAVVSPHIQARYPIVEVQPMLHPPQPMSEMIPLPRRTRVTQESNDAQPPRNFGGTKNQRDVAQHRNQDEDLGHLVRNDVVGGVRNRTAEEVAPGRASEGNRSNNKRMRAGNLNSRSDINNGQFTALRDNIYHEVTNFIRANETRPNFLIQIFQDLQQVTSDSLRQRALHAVQDIVETNNARLETRNNLRVNESRSNLNRSPTERVEELFDHLRENQNTIRQNLGNASASDDLENPNISNLRDLANPPVNPRNNMRNEMRDLRSYFEANLCNFGHGSSLENPNVSNLRENLTEYERMNPKNVYVNLYDNLVQDLRRRNADPDFRSHHHEEQSDAVPPTRPYDLMEVRGGANRDERVSRKVLRRFRNDTLNMASSEESETVPERRKGFLFPERKEVCPDEVRLHYNMPEHEEAFPLRLVSPYQVNPFFNGRGRRTDADLAEADQTRNGETSGAESENDFVNLHQAEAEGLMQIRADSAVNLPEDEIPSADIQFEEAGSPIILESDRNDNLLPAESNNNVFKNVKKRESDVGEAETKQAFLDAIGVEVNDLHQEPLMMDIAGALEHITGQQEDASSEYNLPDLLRGEVEADWELENGLDQVPIRLEKCEPPNDDPT